MANNISVYQGDDETFTATFQDSAGSPVDITGYTVFFTVKSEPTDPDSAAWITKNVTTHSAPTLGSTQFTLFHSETGSMAADSYSYDMQWLDTSGSITTLVVGTFKILQDVTERESV